MSKKTAKDMRDYTAWEYSKDGNDAPGANGHAAWGGAVWAGQRYLAAYGAKVRFVRLHGRWFWWNGQFWEPDDVQEPPR
jgi:hypothetical protein